MTNDERAERLLAYVRTCPADPTSRVAELFAYCAEDARRAALEEAAKITEEMNHEGNTAQERIMALRIAKLIRAAGAP